MSTTTPQHDNGEICSTPNTTCRTPDQVIFPFGHCNHASYTDQPKSDVFSTYCLPVSPLMAEAEMFVIGNASPMYVNPAATWNCSENTKLAASVDMPTTQSILGIPESFMFHKGLMSRPFDQITFPNENDENDTDKPIGKRVKPGFGQDTSPDCTTIIAPCSSPSLQLPKSRMMSVKDRLPKRARKDDHMSDNEGKPVESGDGGKREKYRKKNRIAAAKCRAKKKGLADLLKEAYRTQNELNVALKQTEKSLRDELSFWQTQALQHAFCDCQVIQDYNMRKAQLLAAELILSNPINNRSLSMRRTRSVLA